MCVRKSGGGKKKKRWWGRGGGRRVHCGHANVVDHKQGHKDVMKLNFPNISAAVFTLLFFLDGDDLVPHKFDS